ncbi:MAG: hypothetical protein M0R30_06480 [Methanoregula sp.]|jgi:hypothetical protein|uniref:hypothetical protein n=1 Tax=Methanoregula sp. TaxID=2052170 RepID=UPI0025E3B517|nr:hypothetical protein [Methanoregula sp.]MCK9631274.1 hypothetical protein [Methanoregula sp.]
MRTDAAVSFILVSLAMMYMIMPITSAAVPDDNRQAWPIVTSPELNVTGADIANLSPPSRYEITPTIRVEVKMSDTLLPAPKGEMEAGPRTIGLSFVPVFLAIVIIAIVAGAAGVWYLMKRKPGEKDEDE